LSRVLVEVFMDLKYKLGWSRKEIELHKENPTFKDLLDELKDLKSWLLNENNELARNFIILINGRHIEFTGGLKTTLKDGDEITIFPPSGGG